MTDFVRSVLPLPPPAQAGGSPYLPRSPTHVRRPFLVCTLALLGFVTVPVSAQEVDTLRIQNVLSARCPGAWLQVAASELGRGRGICESVEGGSLVLQSGGSRVSYPLVQLDTVLIRSRATGTGAVLGGLAGAAAFMVAGSATGVCESPRGCNSTALYSALAAAGGAVGALIGSVVGSRTETWRRLVPR